MNFSETKRLQEVYAKMPQAIYSAFIADVASMIKKPLVLKWAREDEWNGESYVPYYWLIVRLPGQETTLSLYDNSDISPDLMDSIQDSRPEIEALGVMSGYSFSLDKLDDPDDDEFLLSVESFWGSLEHQQACDIFEKMRELSRIAFDGEDHEVLVEPSWD